MLFYRWLPKLTYENAAKCSGASYQSKWAWVVLNTWSQIGRLNSLFIHSDPIDQMQLSSLQWDCCGISIPNIRQSTSALVAESLRILRATWGLKMSADVSLSTWEVLWLLKSSLIWLGQYIPYCINTRPCLPNKIILSTYLDICLILKLRIPFGTQMFYLCTIWILHTNSLCNIHSPYNPSWLLCALSD